MESLAVLTDCAGDAPPEGIPSGVLPPWGGALDYTSEISSEISPEVPLEISREMSHDILADAYLSSDKHKGQVKSHTCHFPMGHTPIFPLHHGILLVNLTTRLLPWMRAPVTGYTRDWCGGRRRHPMHGSHSSQRRSLTSRPLAPRTHTPLPYARDPQASGSPA